MACVTERKNVKQVLTGKPEAGRPPGKPTHRWDDNIKMDLQELQGGSMDGLIWLRIGTGGGFL